MKNVVRLDDYRKARKPLRTQPAPPDAPRYFCLSCDSDHFKLYASGSVHCAHCGALIRNIAASDSQAK